LRVWKKFALNCARQSSKLFFLKLRLPPAPFEANDGSILTVVNWLGVALLVPLVACGQSITGRVVDPAQASIGNVVVGLLPVGGDWVTRSTSTDPYGSFRFLSVASGEYVIVARVAGFQSRALTVRVSSGHEADVGTFELRIGSCDSPGTYCDYFSGDAPSRPPVPVVDLCEALKSPDRYGNKPIIIVGILTTVRGWPTLTATCDSMLASGRLSWTNAVLLPEGAVPQQSPTLPDVPDLKRKLVDLAAAVRKTSRSAPAKAAAVYGFLDIPDGLQVVPCTGDSCTRPDIRMPPASFLRVDGFQELK